MSLSEKNVLVTGGSMGIGFAVAAACLRASARVLICARGPDAVDAALQQLQKIAADRVDAVCADVTDRNEIEAALDRLQSRFGKITSLVHAAAIQGPIGSITDVDPNDWMEAVRINLFGTFLVTRQVCSRMKGDGGRIVLFSGGGATSPFPNFTAYACAKAAVVRLAESVAAEMAQSNIEINCLAPGFVATRMHDETLAAGSAAGPENLERVRRLLEKGAVPAEIAADAAAFLLSDRARGISGKLVAAPHDDWRRWPDHLEELYGSDLFTLRRIIPADRGKSWQ